MGMVAMAFLKNREKKPAEGKSKSLGSGKELSKELMEKLVSLARKTVESKLDGIPVPAVTEVRELFGKDFKEVSSEQGAFVTLEYEGQLRGCIGSLIPEGPLWENIRSNALNAAFHDPRFYPVEKKELAKISIEISVLSPLYRMKYSDADDLLSKLEPGVHGVMLRFPNGAGATYLPQVWEDLPQKDVFLSELCRKAEMDSDAWKNLKPEVLVYTVQHAKER